MAVWRLAQPDEGCRHKPHTPPDLAVEATLVGLGNIKANADTVAMMPDSIA
jgi:hypothetical protein